MHQEAPIGRLVGVAPGTLSPARYRSSTKIANEFSETCLLAEALPCVAKISDYLTVFPREHEIVRAFAGDRCSQQFFHQPATEVAETASPQNNKKQASKKRTEDNQGGE